MQQYVVKAGSPEDRVIVVHRHGWDCQGCLFGHPTCLEDHTIYNPYKCSLGYKLQQSAGGKMMH